MLALGFCNSESLSLLLEEVQLLIEDYSNTRTSVSTQALEVLCLPPFPLYCTVWPGIWETCTRCPAAKSIIDGITKFPCTWLQKCSRGFGHAVTPLHFRMRQSRHAAKVPAQP